MLIETAIWLYLLYYISSLYFNKNRYPKGPIPLPFIGNALQIVFEAWKVGGIVNALKSYKRKYGNVFTLWFGPMPTVHIVDYELAKDQMVKHGSDYTLRFTPEISLVEREGLGIILNDGPTWLEHRRFALHTLRNFGLGRNIMEERIMDEFNHRLEKLKQTMENGEVALNPMTFFDVLVGNIINQMLFTDRFSEDNEEFWHVKKLFDEQLEMFTFLDAVAPYWLMMSPLLKWRTDILLRPDKEMKKFMLKKVERRMKEIESGERVLTEESTDFTDSYLYKMQQDKKNGEESSFDIPNLIVDLEDLWSAGQETTTTTLTWATALLLHKPEYIDKVYHEVHDVTKGTRHISLTDKADTPVLNATINEIQRFASILNFNLFRKTAKEQVIEGYKVPADVPISAQISVIMSDDETFPDSEEFDPTRFLNDEKKASNVVPFGMGKRACLGESLARAELYLILGNFLLNCDIKPYGKVPEPKPLNNSGFLKRPPRFNCKFVLRK